MSGVTTNKQNSVLLRFWRGEVHMAVAFWPVGLFLSSFPLFLPPLFDRVAEGFGRDHPLWALCEFLGLHILILVTFVFWAVGLWRSAGRYRSAARASGTWTLWSHLARLVAIMMVLMIGPVGLAASAPILAELFRVAVLGDPDIPSYEIRVLAGGSEVEIGGGIKYGMSSDLIAALDANPGAKVIHLNSGGGRVGEAEILADIVRDRGLDTFVRFSCSSACTTIFLAGERRFADPDAQLGFHGSRFPGMKAGDEHDAGGRWSLQLHLAGIRADFIARAVSVPFSEIWFPSMVEMTAAGVVTALAGEEQFARSLIADRYLAVSQHPAPGTAISLLEEIGGRDLSDALFGFPQERQELLISVQRHIDSGREAEALMLDLSTWSRNVMRRHASGMTRLSEMHSRQLLGQFEDFLSRRDGEECVMYLTHDLEQIGRRPELVAESMALAAEVVRASYEAKGRASLTKGLTESDWISFRQAAKESGNGSSSIDVLKSAQPADADMCASFSDGIRSAVWMEGAPGQRIRGLLLKGLTSL